MKHRKPRQRIAAAVSIDRPLYESAMRNRVEPDDTSFSRYVRELIRRDLSNPTRLDRELAAAK